jgi:hypothetical protein
MRACKSQSSRVRRIHSSTGGSGGGGVEAAEPELEAEPEAGADEAELEDALAAATAAAVELTLELAGSCSRCWSVVAASAAVRLSSRTSAHVRPMRRS